jgi:ETFB lysine methyltransferase
MLRFRYQTIEFQDLDIHVKTLRDVQQCPDDFEAVTGSGLSSSNWPLFGVLWQSEELLSSLMIEQEIKNLRILEIGCGIALASLVLKSRGANITATDHNPDASELLDANTTLNALESITWACTSWADVNEDLGEFDLIIGSDLLYDHHNVDPLVSFIQKHAKPESQIVMVDPRRGLTGKFIRKIESLGFDTEVEKVSHSSDSYAEAELLIMRFARKVLLASS